MGRPGERAFRVVDDRERRGPGPPGGGDGLDDVGRAARLRDPDDERSPEPGGRTVERHERRRGQRDRQARQRAEQVLGVAGRVVGRPSRHDEDESEVRPPERRGETRDACRLVAEKPRDGAGLLADLAVEQRTRHAAMLP